MIKYDINGQPIMSGVQLTEWFDGEYYVPGAVGFYQRRLALSEEFAYSYWNGEHWSAYCKWFSHAVQSKHSKSFRQDLPFRGLTNEEKIYVQAHYYVDRDTR